MFLQTGTLDVLTPPPPANRTQFTIGIGGLEHEPGENIAHGAGASSRINV
jgi:hypothetical protein